VGLDLKFFAVAGLLAFIAWLGLLARLYELSGDTQRGAERNILFLFLGVVVASVVEYWASSLSVTAAYGGANGGPVAQLVVAGVAPVAAGAVAMIRADSPQRYAR
jgi:hypothetical protein